MEGLPESVKVFKKVFDKYAAEEGDKDTLNKKELAKLLRDEFGMKLKGNEQEEQFFKALDADGDDAVSFKEFVGFVITIAMLAKGQK